METAQEASPGASIGLLEDHHVVREALVRALAEAGHQVRFAVGTTEEFMAAMEAEAVQVLLFDLSLRGAPPSDGITLLKSVREWHPSAHVVVLTGLEDPELAAAAMEAGGPATW